MISETLVECRRTVLRDELDMRNEESTTDAVSLKITSCDKCPNIKVEKYYTEDSWEDVMEWKCTIAGDALSRNRRITLHEWNDGVEKIPDWCPLR
jgi:hypothetical protein